MMYMIWFILHDAEKLDDIIQAWEEVGVKGITIYLSSGIARLRKQSMLRDDLPLIPSLNDLFAHEESWSRTLMTIVKDETLLDAVVAATQSVVGDLNLPNTGILSALPLARVYGLDRIDE
jgi:hypothetical protein